MDDSMTATNRGKKPSYRSEYGHVFFLDGWSWGIDLVETKPVDGRRQWEVKKVCLGKEEDILLALKGRSQSLIVLHQAKEES